VKRGGVFASATALLLIAISLSSGTPAAQPAPPTGADEGPPITKLPLNVVEPPRDVPAAQWNSPYCGHWGDGCTECTRAASGAAPVCRAETANKGAQCARHAIICLREFDAAKFDRICSNFYIEKYFGPSRLGTGFSASRNDILVIANEFRIDWNGHGSMALPERVPLFPLGLVDPEYFIIHRGDYSNITGSEEIAIPVGTPYAPDGRGSRYDDHATGLRCWRTYADGVAGGLSEAAASKLAGPPIVELPLKVVEPPRDVAASQWASPYCGDWDDGCVACQRQSLMRPIECNFIDGMGASCRPHLIACRRPMSLALLSSICQRIVRTNLTLSDSGALMGFDTSEPTRWLFASDNKWQAVFEKRDRKIGLGKWLPYGRFMPLSRDEQRSYQTDEDIGFSYICEQFYKKMGIY
jgi:hypothetical protein